MTNVGYEVNFGGLVGPTHHYAGLSFGNEASMGLKQGVIAPQARPHIPTLRQLGFHGNDREIVSQAMKASPGLLSNFKLG